MQLMKKSRIAYITRASCAVAVLLALGAASPHVFASPTLDLGDSVDLSTIAAEQAQSQSVLTINVKKSKTKTMDTVIADSASSSLAILKKGAGTLLLGGANTYSGGTTINAGTVTANIDSALGLGNVTLGSVSVNANHVTLNLQNGATNNYISNNARLSLGNGAIMNLNFSGTDLIGGLVINGVVQTIPGTYGSSHSGAQLPVRQFLPWRRHTYSHPRAVNLGDDDYGREFARKRPTFSSEEKISRRGRDSRIGLSRANRICSRNWCVRIQLKACAGLSFLLSLACWWRAIRRRTTCSRRASIEFTKSNPPPISESSMEMVRSEFLPEPLLS